MMMKSHDVWKRCDKGPRQKITININYNNKNEECYVVETETTVFFDPKLF